RRASRSARSAHASTAHRLVSKRRLERPSHIGARKPRMKTTSLVARTLLGVTCWAGLAAALAAPAAASAAATCRAASGDTTTALVELYTSEGCDSCPPADRWLSRLHGETAGRSFVAVAYHVDYWDRL